MTYAEIARRALWLAFVFVALRFVEAFIAIGALAVVGGVEESLKTGRASTQSIGDQLLGTWFVVRTYYFSLGYLYFSAIVFVAVAFFRGIKCKRTLMLTNLCAFVAHSIAVIVMIFGGAIGYGLWIVWTAIAIANWVAPNLLWKFAFLRRTEHP